MAECSLYGDLVPNSYVDKVFIEEALVDTNNDGVIDLETPKISINIRLVDELSDNGTFSMLEQALEVQLKQGEGQAAQRGAETVNLKDYFKVWCILSNTQELTEKFEEFFEEGNNSGNFKWTNNNIETGRYNSKTLNDAISTYENSDGTVQIIIPYLFDLDANKPVQHLTIFTYVQLDTESLEADFNLKMPESLKNLVSRFEEEIVIQNSSVNPELRIFLTEGGEIWNGAVHVHNGQYMEGATHTSEPHGFLTKTSAPINNVQDFRIRDEINALIAEFENLTTLQNTFPGQQEILNRTISKNSYFSEILLTKDEDRNTRFLFAFDYGKYVLENSKYSSLILKMSPAARRAIVLQSQIVQFILNKKQVKKECYWNKLNSPVQNFILNDETPTTPVILSLDDTNLNEINLILPNQEETDNSIVRYFTGVDTDIKSDGTYQYGIDVEVLDGFIPLMNFVFKALENTISEYEKYVALTQIPNIYDPDARKFTPDGINIMSSGSDSLSQIVSVYLTVLSYFVEIDSTQLESFELKILNSISPTNGTVDGVLIFKDMLNLLLAQINNIMSAGHSSGGVEDTLQNQPANNTSVFKLQSMRLTEDFDNTIDSRFINESYVDNISANKTRAFAGLTIYNFSELSNASQTLFPKPVAFSGLSQQELLEEQAKQEETLAYKGVNIIFQSEDEYLKSAKNTQASQRGNQRGGSPLSQNKLKSSTNYLGQSSKGAVGNLNVNNMSPQALFTETLNDKLRGTEQSLFWNGSLLEALPFEQEPLAPVKLKTQVNVLTGFVRQAPTPIRQSVFVTTQDIASMTPEPLIGAFASPNGATKTPIYNLILKDTLFETTQLGDLTLPPGSDALSSYYLCNQTRQGDIDVIDSFFLLRPQSTFVTTQDIASMTPEPLIGASTVSTVAGPNEIMQQIASTTPEPLFSSSRSGGTTAGANSMQIATVENALARNASKTGRAPIDTTSSSRTETKTSGEEEARAEAMTISQSRGQLAGLGAPTATAPTLNNGGFGGGGGGYGG